MAAWLLQLRTRLLLPADSPPIRDAAVEAYALGGRLIAPETCSAGRLAGAAAVARPRRFARGQPKVFGVSAEAGQAIDVIEFLWASLALFDDPAAPEVATGYRPLHLDLYAVAEARAPA
jgi:segregation and condensation protein A